MAREESEADEIDWGARLLSEAGRRDPYPIYRQMRAAAPFHFSAAAQSWFATRYEDVVRLSSAATLGARSKAAQLDALPPSVQPTFRRVEEFFGSWIAFADPPAHTRRRAGLREVITPVAVEPFRAPLAALGTSLAETLQFGVEVDLLEAFLEPFVLRGIGLLLGLAEEERVEAWSCAVDLMCYLTAAGWQEASAERAIAGAERLRRLVLGSVLPRASSPFSARLRALLERGDFDESEAVGSFAQYLTGGVEPTRSALVTACRHALAPSGEALRGDPSGVVDEALRFDAPFHFASRTAKEALTVNQANVAPGDVVKLVIASANRDEQVFDRSEEFLTSGRARHGSPLSFGRGRHSCVGAPFARLQMDLGLSALFALEPPIVLATEPERLPSFGSTAYGRVLVVRKRSR
jgi:cytochrome P450